MSSFDKGAIVQAPVISVLIADDHPPFSQGLSRILDEQEDLRPVGTANEGTEAVRLALTIRPDVVLMDISMPNVNGIEATRQIKANLPNTAILVLSAYGYYPYVVSALDAGAGGYLLKTAPLRDVVSAIRALRAGEAVLEHSVAEKLLKTVSGSLKGDLPATHLSERELEVLRASLRGLSNRAIGEELGVAERTVQAYFTSIFTKLNVGSRLEAVVQGLKQGWITLEDLPQP